MRHQLSKSTFLKGSQCPKALYLHKYYPELRDAISEMQLAVFKRGTEVGILAQQLYPGGINASPNLPKDFEGAIRYTAELVEGGCPVIYEAGFSHQGVHCFVDILVREKEGWHAYEVKSSTNLSNVYQLDAALQYWVMRGSGLKMNGIDIVLLNNRYIRQGPLEIGRLFGFHPVTKQVERLQARIGEKIGELIETLSLPGIPEVEIGPHCTDPYICDFKGYCWKGIPEESVFEVAGLTGKKKWELFKRGIVRLQDIPDDYSLNPSQKIQVWSARSGGEKWDRPAIEEFVNSLHYPLYFLDFESFQPAIPLFDNSRPYQQIPFQYSLHILESVHSPMIHREFLAEAGPDPRPEFVRRLSCDLGDDGDIIVYNKAFEKQILKDLSRDLPGIREMMDKLIARIHDLMVPFQQKRIYLPEMKGSHSIKHVFPALIRGEGYGSLDIADGGSASIAYEGLFHTEDESVVIRTRQQLLDYCRMDTLAMVKIWERIRDF